MVPEGTESLELTRRITFLTTRYPIDENASGKSGCQKLREAATYRNLSIGRSTSRRIMFYPRGMDKKGNTIASFSCSNSDPDHWVLTGIASQALARWNRVVPISDIQNQNLRRQSVVWNEKSRSFLLHLKATTELTQKAIAKKINDSGSAYRHPESRMFREDDVKRELRRLFQAKNAQADNAHGDGNVKRANAPDSHAGAQEGNDESNMVRIPECNDASEIRLRRKFLLTRYMVDIVSGSGAIGSQGLRRAALKRNLCVGRSTVRRVMFYPRGYAKKGNTVATFSRNKHDPDHWVVTGNVNELLTRWNRIIPLSNVPDSAAMSKPVIWTQLCRSLLVRLKTTTELTPEEIASRLNQPEYRHIDSRLFTKDDVKYELRRLFPQDLDVHQIIWSLRELKNHPGWETLSYLPEQVETATGTMLRSLVVILPHAERLAELFGSVIHVDCTYDSIIYGQKVRPPLIHILYLYYMGVLRCKN